MVELVDPFQITDYDEQFCHHPEGWECYWCRKHPDNRAHQKGLFCDCIYCYSNNLKSANEEGIKSTINEGIFAWTSKQLKMLDYDDQ